MRLGSDTGDDRTTSQIARKLSPSRIPPIPFRVNGSNVRLLPYLDWDTDWTILVLTLGLRRDLTQDELLRQVRDCALAGVDKEVPQ